MRRKLLSLLLIFSIIFSPVGAYAEEATSSSTIVTGETDASAQTDILANITVATVSGETVINNEADISSATVATSSSGLNQSINDAGSIFIDAGSASASATTENIINLNDLTASDSATISAQNEAEVKTEDSAQSISGLNTASGSGESVTVTTGDTFASAAIANIINTNLVGSNYRFLIYNIYQNQTGTIDLNEIWKELETNMGNSNMMVGIKNTASIQAILDVRSLSGQNTASNSAGNVSVVTGNSYASANLFNLINTNAVGANFLFVVVNIFGSLNGDIVVPSQERFNESLVNHPEVAAGEVSLNNYARVEGSQVLAKANSGSNTNIGGNNQITNTGEAFASATTIDILNTNISWQNWMSFILNDFGSWSGDIRGWNGATNPIMLTATPGAQITSDELIIAATNSAVLTASVSAVADTGNNKTINIGGDNLISTGRAVALANVVNFINTNIFGGNFILAFINLFGQWNGNFVFAYPDLQVGITSGASSLQPGQETHLTVAYKNVGYEEARNGQINITIPGDMTYEGNDLSLIPTVSGSTYSFFVGRVLKGEGGQIILKVRVKNDVSFEQRAAGFSLIRAVYADDKQKDLVVNAKIVTSDLQANQVNHSADATITINSQSDTADTGAKGLVVTSWNNVGDFVYPGDIVTFEVTVKNTGDRLINNVVVSQDIRDGEPIPIGSTVFDIDIIEAGETVKISYGVMIPDDVKEEVYKSTVIASGDGITSNEAINSFLIKLKYRGIVPVVSAEETRETNNNSVNINSEVLGIQKNRNYLPYAIILAGLALSAYKVTSALRRRK